VFEGQPVRRRDFITLVGGAAAGWPLAARAQQPAIPLIGFLSGGEERAFAPNVAGFIRGLKDIGYVEGQNVAIEYRWAEGDYDRLPTMANELAHRPAAVLVASGGTTVVRAAKAATGTIPIVFATADDPVVNGLVASLNRPGENITGVALLSNELAAKRFGLVRELIPQAKSIALLVNTDNPESRTIVKGTEAAANSTGTKLIVVNASTQGDLGSALKTAVQEHARALIVGADPLFYIHRDQLIALAARDSIPAIYFLREFVAAGGLMSYGTNFADAYRQLGAYVGRILKGEKASDLPVLQPTKFELSINMKTAKALGLAIPAGVLAIADEVIE
jgi:putative tryptophan/tyrosine transport system substrate-binding protein